MRCPQSHPRVPPGGLACGVFTPRPPSEPEELPRVLVRTSGGASDFRLLLCASHEAEHICLSLRVFYYSHFIDVQIEPGELTDLLSFIQLLGDSKEALTPEPLTIPSAACPRLREHKSEAERSQRCVEDGCPNEPHRRSALPMVEEGVQVLRDAAPAPPLPR